MIEEIRRLQNPEKYYKALEKLKMGKTPLLIPKNKELILQFLNDAEIGRTILKGQKRKNPTWKITKNVRAAAKNGQ